MSVHERGLLDTGVVVSLGGLTDPGGLPVCCFVSAVTRAELSVGPLARSDAERAARQSMLQQVEADLDAIAFDDRAARAPCQVAAQLCAAGRKTTARAYDALIAATALADDLSVSTRNLDDFTGIASVKPAADP